jgi:hypothetical protein
MSHAHQLPSGARAFSYLRFSTPEQMKGDSFRRQSSMAAAYARQHGLELDVDLTFHDLGKSAFRGQNIGEAGRLGDFLEAVKRSAASIVVPQPQNGSNTTSPAFELASIIRVKSDNGFCVG